MLCLNRAVKRTGYTQFIEEYIAALTHFTLHIGCTFPITPIVMKLIIFLTMEKWNIIPLLA